MRHRTFIAVNLPEEIKKKIGEYQSRWPELPCRWTKKENLHITLVFLGGLSDEELLRVCEATRKVGSGFPPFSVSLKKIAYGPPKKPPRMVWAIGESKELSRLRKELASSLGDFSGEKEKSYAVHITLARIKSWGLRRMEPEEIPRIDEEIDLSFEVSSIEVMESDLKRGGPEYVVLESVSLDK